MANSLFIPVKESVQELKALLKKSIPFLKPRIQLLLAMKKNGDNPTSKRALMEQTGLCSYSVQKWRSLYAKGGVQLLLVHNKTGFKKSIIDPKTKMKLEEKLNDPENGLRGYKELLEWVITEFKSEISYNTLYKFCRKNFGTKIKVARKYHAKKDEEAVNSFKKTSVKSARKP
jgi:transposase